MFTGKGIPGHFMHKAEVEPIIQAQSLPWRNILNKALRTDPYNRRSRGSAPIGKPLDFSAPRAVRHSAAKEERCLVWQHLCKREDKAEPARERRLS
jgi:chorismate-pyruvate lyase